MLYINNMNYYTRILFICDNSGDIVSIVIISRRIKSEFGRKKYECYLDQVFVSLPASNPINE